jgi:type IV secretion system protein VirD4
MFVGLLLLILVNIGATQFVAYRLEYQPALGSPLLRYQLHSIYQPFAWAPLLLKYGSSADSRIRLPLLSGALIVVAGAAIAVMLVYGINLRRAKRLSANAEDLHGSARWATPADIEATGLLDRNRASMWVVGALAGSNRLHYLGHNGPQHVLAFAPTRSGKGVGLVIPTLLAWSESAVVYDIKGENWAKTAGFRAKCGHLCFKFSPVEFANGSRFNPLAEVRIGTPRDVSDAQNVADMIVRTGEESPQERYWQDAAASITAACGQSIHTSGVSL